MLTLKGHGLEMLGGLVAIVVVWALLVASAF